MVDSVDAIGRVELLGRSSLTKNLEVLLAQFDKVAALHWPTTREHSRRSKM
jgi:hypothetical protein